MSGTPPCLHQAMSKCHIVREKSTYPPARIVSTTLPGIAGRADESTKGGVFNDVLTPVRGVASKVANERVESTRSRRSLSEGGGGDLLSLLVRQRVGILQKYQDCL